MPEQRLALVDASPYIFRAHFSLPSSIRTPDGGAAAAMYGFAGFLQRLLSEEKPSHVAVAFDGSLTTSFRNDLLPDYKAGREPPPQELVDQLEGCRDLAAAFGCATFVDDRLEADDLIGSLARVGEAARVSVSVVSSDKDLAQLVDDRIEFFDFARGDHLGPGDVVERFGVRPGQIPSYLGLAGDSVDNIPGVKGIGKKTAVALLQEFDDLEAVYQGLGEVEELALRGAASIAMRLEAQTCGGLPFARTRNDSKRRPARCRADRPRVARGPGVSALRPVRALRFQQPSRSGARTALTRVLPRGRSPGGIRRRS